MGSITVKLPDEQKKEIEEAAEREIILLLLNG